MPRKRRIDYPGAWHHVMNRGARRAPIFKLDEHCWLFLEVLEGVVKEFDIECHAYSLMPNHYHLLLRSKHGNLSDGMRRLGAMYTQQVNAMSRWDGPLFRGRFRNQLVSDETRLPYILAYIHLNPLRANLVTRLGSPNSWTSHRPYIGKEKIPSWLSTEYFLELFESNDSLHQYILDVHRGKMEWPEEFSPVTGWFVMRGADYAEQDRHGDKSSVSDGKAMLENICEITGVSRKELMTPIRGPGANPARRFAVWALKRSALLTHREIGKLLNMTSVQVANVLRRYKSNVEPFTTWKNVWNSVGYMTSDGS